MPSVKDAILDFNAQLEVITKEISLEYTRMFNADEINEGNKGASPRSKAHHSATMTSYQSPAQLREQREVRKEKFLTEFNHHPKFQQLRDRLKKTIVRLAVEKHQRTVGSAPQTQV